jgi:hypothetical protein
LFLSLSLGLDFASFQLNDKDQVVFSVSESLVHQTLCTLYLKKAHSFAEHSHEAMQRILTMVASQERRRKKATYEQVLMFLIVTLYGNKPLKSLLSDMNVSLSGLPAEVGDYSSCGSCPSRQR